MQNTHIDIAELFIGKLSQVLQRNEVNRDFRTTAR